MKVVLDTNILVSALWSPGRKASLVVKNVILGNLTACYDERIADEYERVLRYPKLGFSEEEVRDLLSPIFRQGLIVRAHAYPNVIFQDESDKKFYETAKTCGAVLVSGNLKHFPDDPMILSLSDFCEKYIFKQ